MRFRNQLPESSIVALARARCAWKAQTDIHDWQCHRVANTSTTSRSSTARATSWYHPHPHMRTAAQAYQGLAGLFLVADDEEGCAEAAEWIGRIALRPAGPSRRRQQSTRLSATGRLRHEWPHGPRRNGRGGMMQMMETMNGWLGDRMLVSGRIQPTIDVDRRTHACAC